MKKYAILGMCMMLGTLLLASLALAGQNPFLLVKFTDVSGISVTDNGNWITAGHDLAPLQRILQQYRLIAATRVFNRFSPTELDRLREMAEQKTDLNIPNLNRHVRLEFAPGTDMVALRVAIRQLTLVEDAQISEVVPPPVVVPDDPLAINSVNNGQWYLYQTKVAEAWQVADGSGVVMADCDAGFQLDHPELNDNFLPDLQEDFGNPGDDVADGSYESHGTSVMGIVAAESNHEAIAGAAHEAKLIPLQYWNYDGTDIGSFEQNIGNCILGAQQKGADMIILEAQSGNGSAEYFLPVRDAVATVVAAGTPVVAAAGNYDKELLSEAAYDTGSIIIGATDLNNARAIWGVGQASNYGERVDVATPGIYQYTTTVGSSYTSNFGGTSGATPTAAGVVALMLSLDPSLTPTEIRDVIRSSATVISTDKPIGGLLNARAAVDAISNPDLDGDGILNSDDNCPRLANPDQADDDGDGLGDVCDPCPHDSLNDPDQDAVCDAIDNCQGVANPDQLDGDNDSIGDACDSDKDNDGASSELDCDDLNPAIYPGARETHHDGIDSNCNGSDSCGMLLFRPQSGVAGLGLLLPLLSGIFLRSRRVSRR